MRFYHAAPKETMMKIYAEGVLKKSWDGVVYMCKDPIDACKFLVIRGMRQMSVIELELDEKEVEESHDHSFYERSLDNAYEISVDESNLVSGDTKAAEAIKAWFSKVQEKNGGLG